MAEGQEEEEEEGEEEGEGEGVGGAYYNIQEEEEKRIALGETVVAKGREPHPRRARFELHKYVGGREGMEGGRNPMGEREVQIETLT